MGSTFTDSIIYIQRMLILRIIGHLSTLSWFILPLTQRRSKYFYYFLLMAITGLYGTVVFAFHFDSPYKVILATSVLTIPALFRDYLGKHKAVLLVFGLFIYVVFYNLSEVSVEWIGVVLDTIVLLIISAQIIKDILHTNRIRIVWVVLLVYHISLVIKSQILLMEPDQNSGVILFYNDVSSSWQYTLSFCQGGLCKTNF